MTGLLEGGWILTGTDRADNSLTIWLSDRDLIDSDWGITIGRHPALCDHVIDDPSVSRRHIRFSARDGSFTVEDLNSLNGTLIEGTDIPSFRRAHVEEGQSLMLGHVKLRLTRVSG